MKRQFVWFLGWGTLVALIGACVWGFREHARPQSRADIAHRTAPRDVEWEARRIFEQRYPDQKPLNWRIAEVAERLYHEEPMGRFVLHENDCSDFVGCVVDEALGPGARFNREGNEHALCGKGGVEPRSLFEIRRLPKMGVVQPGDIVHVRHSPWYPPNDESIGHAGVIGPEGRVIDFSKLKSWASARYHCISFERFIQHNAPDEVVIGRLRPEYRYRLVDIEQP